MVNNILIVPVGLEKDRILESVQKIPINKIYLLTDTNLIEKEPETLNFLKKITKKFFNDIQKIWGPVFGNNLKLINVSLSDLEIVIEIVGKIIKSEIDNDLECKIFINISTATKIFAVICSQIASIFPKNVIPFYLGTQNYLFPYEKDKEVSEALTDSNEFIKHGLTTKPYTMVEIPVLPIIELNQIARQILNELAKKQNRTKKFNIKNLSELLGYNYEKQSDRKKITYWCSQLSKGLFLTMIPQPKGYEIQITSAGCVFMKLIKILN